MECVLTERTLRYLFESWQEYTHKRRLEAFGKAILQTHRLLRYLTEWRNLTLADCFRRYCERVQLTDNSKLVKRLLAEWHYQRVGVYRVAHILQWGVFRKNISTFFLNWRTRLRAQRSLQHKFLRLRAVAESRRLQTALTRWISNFLISQRLQARVHRRSSVTQISGKEDPSISAIFRASPEIPLELDRTLLYTPSELSFTVSRFPPHRASSQSLLGLRRKPSNYSDTTLKYSRTKAPVVE